MERTEIILIQSIGNLITREQMQVEKYELGFIHSLRIWSKPNYMRSSYSVQPNKMPSSTRTISKQIELATPTAKLKKENTRSTE